MSLVLYILVAVAIALVANLLWIYCDFRRYMKRFRILLLPILLISYTDSLSAQYIDHDCKVSFRWYDNQRGELKYQSNELTYHFIPNEKEWEIIIKNNSEEEAKINWKHTQLIINGWNCEIAITPKNGEGDVVSVKSQEEASCRIQLAADKKNKKIYDRKDIRKGNRKSISLILATGTNKQPQFFHTFDFVVTVN